MAYELIDCDTQSFKTNISGLRLYSQEQLTIQQLRTYIGLYVPINNVIQKERINYIRDLSDMYPMRFLTTGENINDQSNSQLVSHLPYELLSYISEYMNCSMDILRMMSLCKHIFRAIYDRLDTILSKVRFKHYNNGPLTEIPTFFHHPIAFMKIDYIDSNNKAIHLNYVNYLITNTRMIFSNVLYLNINSDYFLI
jgi:hypothetical protein